MGVLAGGVFGGAADDLTDLRNLVDDIGSGAFDARIGHRTLPDSFDAVAWGHLQDAGLTRLNGGSSVMASGAISRCSRHCCDHCLSRMIGSR